MEVERCLQLDHISRHPISTDGIPIINICQKNSNDRILLKYFHKIRYKFLGNGRKYELHYHNLIQNWNMDYKIYKSD